MLSKVEATIYLADQRGCSEATWFRSYYTLNFGEFMRETRRPFGSLLAVNEHTLKEGRTLSFVQTEPLKVLLIPITGKLNYLHGLPMPNSGNVEKSVDVGQASYMSLPPGVPLELSNSYTSNSIRFLHINMCIDGEVFVNQDDICSFEPAADRSELSALTTRSEELFYVGKLRGREEVICRSKIQRSGFFVYQISGTCEVSGRLLLPGDALSLINVETIEFEALTHEAIVFVAEVPFPAKK